jgi:hypothetical protein
MSMAVIFGAVISCAFVAAIWLNLKGPIPSQETSEQTGATAQTDEKDKSEQTAKPSPKRIAKKRTDVCAENCESQWELPPLAPWPSDESRR